MGKQDWGRLFRMLDIDHSGHIDLEELKYCHCHSLLPLIALCCWHRLPHRLHRLLALLRVAGGTG